MYVKAIQTAGSILVLKICFPAPQSLSNFLPYLPFVLFQRDQMYILNIFKNKKAKMKTSLKHGRTFGWCVIVPLTSPWITACPVTSGGARGRSLPTESFQAANQQRLFAFLVLLWTKTHSVSNARNQLLAAIYFHRGAAGVSAPAGTRASAAQRPVSVPRVQQQPLQCLLPPRCPRLGPGQLWSCVAVKPCIRLLGKQLMCENPHPGPRPRQRSRI